MADKFSIEMGDRPRPGRNTPYGGYGVVHATGCSDLIDPEPVGDDWRKGVAELGDGWEEEVADGTIKLAPCANALDKS